MICPECEGKGVIFALGCGSKGPIALTLDCELCGKSGSIDDRKTGWRNEGRRMRDERIERGLTLRKESERRGMDPILLSKMERGIVGPVKG